MRLHALRQPPGFPASPGCGPQGGGQGVEVAVRQRVYVGVLPPRCRLPAGYLLMTGEPLSPDAEAEVMFGDAWGKGGSRPLRLKGHAWRGVESNVYNDRRYACECGDKGPPVRSVDDARSTHREHKRRVIEVGHDCSRRRREGV